MVYKSLGKYNEALRLVKLNLDDLFLFFYFSYN